MPRVERKGRANKKRGKKGGKKEEVEDKQQNESVNIQPEPMEVESSSSGVVFNDQHFQSAHYGEVDEEMLGYFKGVEKTLDDPPFETGEGNDVYRSREK